MPATAFDAARRGEEIVLPPSLDVEQITVDLGLALSERRINIGTVLGKLIGQSPETLTQVQEDYQRKYNKNLRDDLTHALKGTNLKLALDLLDGKVKDVPAIRKMVERMEVAGDYTARAPQEAVAVPVPDGRAGGYQDANLPPDRRRTDITAERFDANKIAADLNTAMSGWNWDESAVQNLLENKSVQQVEAIKLAYKQNFNRKLPEDLETALGKEQAIVLLAGADEATIRTAQIEETVRADDNHIKAREGFSADEKAEQIYNALVGNGTRKEALFATLESMNSTEAARTAEAFQKNYKENMADWIKSDLSGDDELRAVALLQGNIEENGFEEKGKAREGFDAGARAEQVYNAVTGFGTDEEGLFDAISNLNKDEIELLTAEYQKKYQTDLTSRIRGELSGIDLEIANTYLSGEVNEQGNNTKAIALRLARAMESWGTIDSEISHSLTMQPLTQIEKGEVELAYKWKTGRSLNEAFEGDLGKGQLQQARSLLADSDVGTDTGRAKEVIDTYWNGRKDQLIEIFAGKTPEHNQKVIENFENQFGENFYDAAKKGSWAGLSEKDLSILRKVVETGEAPAGLR